MSFFSKILFLLLCLIHLVILLAFTLPLFVAVLFALVPLLMMARPVLRNSPNLSPIRGMCGLFIAMDLFLVWAGYATIQANAASAAKGGGLMGGLGELLMALAVVLGILSAVCFSLIKKTSRPPSEA